MARGGRRAAALAVLAAAIAATAIALRSCDEGRPSGAASRPSAEPARAETARPTAVAPRPARAPIDDGTSGASESTARSSAASTERAAPTATATAAAAAAEEPPEFLGEGEIVGRVSDEAGAPIPGATVAAAFRDWAAGLDDPRHARFAKTDDQGLYRLDRVPAGRIRVGADDGAHVYAERVLDVPEGGRAHVDLVLRAGGSIAGHVFDGAGRPIDGATVTASGFEAIVDRATRTAEDGSWWIAGLPAGQTYVDAGAAGRAAPPSRVVPLAAAQSVAGIDFVLEPGAFLRGRVLGPDGAPLEGIVVACTRPGQYFRWWRKSAEGGAYELGPLPSGNARIVARADDRPLVAALDVALKPGEERSGVDLLLEEARGGIRGAVRDEAGAPIAGAHVIAQSSSGWAQTKTDAAGAFALPGLPEGAWRLHAVAPGYAASPRLDVTLALDGALDGIALRVGRPAPLGGRIRPVPSDGARVEVFAAFPGSNDFVSMAEAEPDGAFSFDRAPAGDLDVFARTNDLSLLGRAAARGEARDLEIVLAPGASIAGRVAFADGRPAAGMQVQSRLESGGGVRYAIADAGGCYVIRGLYAGRHAVSAAGGAPREITVAAGERAESFDLLAPSGEK